MQGHSELTFTTEAVTRWTTLSSKELSHEPFSSCCCSHLNTQQIAFAPEEHTDTFTCSA